MLLHVCKHLPGRRKASAAEKMVEAYSLGGERDGVVQGSETGASVYCCGS